MQQRTERVEFETDRHLIRGELTMPESGYRSRLTDFLSSADHDFIAMTDVEIEPLGGGEAARHPYIAIARRSIVIARPLADG